MVVTRCPDTRWAWVEIDHSALRRNVKAYKSLLKGKTRMLCVVKADAYGHGAVQCARTMRNSGADAFAVATVDEGVELREAGINEPIVILSQPPEKAVRTIVEHRLEPAVYDPDFALALGEAAVSLGTVARYHFAIDSGMTRIGVPWNVAREARRVFDFHRGLECAGTFTHFATADVPNDWDWELAYKHFSDAVASIRDAGMDCGIVHCDNTPGTVLHPNAHRDMVRVGIGLYGLQPSRSCEQLLPLEPVMSVRARLTRVAEPPVGAGVSYGLTWRVPKDGVQVGTVPIGYADGLSRTLSGRMDVLVGGQRLHQVGRICMDQFMIASDMRPLLSRPAQPALQVGDVVTLVGRDGDEEITMDEMAELRGTINYEVACNFGMRLDKIHC